MGIQSILTKQSYQPLVLYLVNRPTLSCIGNVQCCLMNENSITNSITHSSKLIPLMLSVSIMLCNSVLLLWFCSSRPSAPLFTVMSDTKEAWTKTFWRGNITNVFKVVSCLFVDCLQSLKGCEDFRTFWTTKQLLKDGAYYCYCAYVLRISRYSGFLWVVPAIQKYFCVV